MVEKETTSFFQRQMANDYCITKLRHKKVAAKIKELRHRKVAVIVSKKTFKSSN